MPQLKTYTPTTILDFGKFKGEELRFVYMFDPEYVEWLTIHCDWFFIDLEAFSNLHTSPISHWGQKNSPNAPSVDWDGFVHVNGNPLPLREFLSQYTNAMETYEFPPETPYRFEFSARAKETLAKKLAQVNQDNSQF